MKENLQKAAAVVLFLGVLVTLVVCTSQSANKEDKGPSVPPASSAAPAVSSATSEATPQTQLPNQNVKANANSNTKKVPVDAPPDAKKEKFFPATKAPGKFF